MERFRLKRKEKEERRKEESNLAQESLQLGELSAAHFLLLCALVLVRLEQLRLQDGFNFIEAFRARGGKWRLGPVFRREWGRERENAWIHQHGLIVQHEALAQLREIL